MIKLSELCPSGLGIQPLSNFHIPQPHKLLHAQFIRDVAGANIWIDENDGH